MKQSIQLAILALLIPVLSVAQPTITKDWIGNTGDITTSRSSAVIPDVTPSGANAMWDFSAITPADTIITGSLYVNPDTTTFIGDFPGANRCQYAQFVDSEFGVVAGYSYHAANDASYENYGQGIASEVFGEIKREFTDREVILTFPFNYQDQHQDDYVGTFDLGIVKIFFEGNVSVTADAWGTVEVPGGTFDNCMRLSFVRTEIDSTDLGLGIIEKTHATTKSYVWLSAAHPGPIAVYETNESFSVAIVNPLPPDTTATQYDTAFQYDQTATSSAARYFEPTAYEFGVSPNPFQTELTLQYTLDKPEVMDFEIQTINGQVVYTRKINGASGQNIETLDAAEIGAGIYIAILRGKTKAGIQKLIKID